MAIAAVTMAEVAEFPGWKRQLATRKSGEPYPDERNILIALTQAPELRDLLQYNAFSDRVEIRRPIPGTPRDSLDALFQDDRPAPWTDEHVTELTIWLTREGFTRLRAQAVHSTAIAFAKRNSYHPVLEYLEQTCGRWDGKPRIDEWLSTYLAARDNADYLRNVGPKFLIGAVARIYDPGCQMDTMLVLEGDQGKGKSTVAHILGCDTWTHEMHSDLSSKDAAVGIQSVWICELPELSALRRSEQEAIKSFISRRIDHYRPPYGRNSIDRPRHTVFIATTNENEYLQDPTGARRFWPVACTSIDRQALRRDLDQLWGEAVTRYKAHEPWYLDEAQGARAVAEQKARERLTPLDATVAEYAEGLLDSGLRRIEMRQLLNEVFDISTKKDPAKAGAVAQQVARALIREGWKRLKPTGRGKTRVQAYEFQPAEPSQGSQASQAKVDGSTHLYGPETLTSSQASQALSGEEDEIPF